MHRIGGSGRLWTILNRVSVLVQWRFQEDLKRPQKPGKLQVRNSVRGSACTAVGSWGKRRGKRMADKTANTTPQTTNVPRMLWFAAAACAFNSGLIALWLTCFAILSSRVTTLAPVIVGVLTPVAAGHILLDCSIVCTAIRTAKPGCRRTKEV